MRSLLENLEQTKDELLNRLSNSTTEKRSGDNEKALLLNDMQNQQRDLLAKDQIILDLKKSVAQLDSNMDDLQSDLDRKTEEVSVLN
jgi:chromosome segregation ATPase